MGRERLMNIVLVVVTLVWAGSFAADVFVPNYQPPLEIHSIFMAIVGGVFVASSAGGGPSGSGNDNSGRTEEETETPTEEQR